MKVAIYPGILGLDWWDDLSLGEDSVRVVRMIRV